MDSVVILIAYIRLFFYFLQVIFWQWLFLQGCTNKLFVSFIISRALPDCTRA